MLIRLQYKICISSTSIKCYNATGMKNMKLVVPESADALKIKLIDFSIYSCIYLS